ncbi:hypothetical protein [Luteimonas aquatica]|uniref:hypothetical protein n=1 Tax=Luteimonas aquatica TaxID=450364 RepID=UPI001F5909AE|nr:hypothetical protein [Luteimonas aquatica]
MDEMLDAFAESQKGTLPGPWERWSFAIGFMGAGAGMLLGVLLEGRAAMVSAVAGLVVELSGFALSLMLLVKREWRAFRSAKRNYACELDRDFTKYQQYVNVLRLYPAAERSMRLHYILGRRRTLQRRLGLFSGGLERLGVLPVIFVLYLQFKDWEWGDWGMLAEINLVQGLLIWALLLAYAMGWYLLRLNDRIELYEVLLEESLRQDEEGDLKFV